MKADTNNIVGVTFYNNLAKTIPWQTFTTQPTIPQQPGYWILQEFYGIIPSTPTPSPAP
jgi:spore coat protein U-like protein